MRTTRSANRFAGVFMDELLALTILPDGMNQSYNTVEQQAGCDLVIVILFSSLKAVSRHRS